MRHALSGLLLLALTITGAADTVPAKPEKTPKQALRAFQDLIGSWRAAGNPEGTRDEKQKGFWTETLSWEWQFKDKDAWLKVDFQNGKHFTRGELRYLPAKDQYQLTLQTTGKETLTFTGPLQDRRLTLERRDEGAKETHRLVVSLLHANRFLYRYDVKPDGKPLFSTRFQVGATKEGVPFAATGSTYPECVVSGGRGTMPVTHNGKTYYVCCTGCRDAFKDDPEKFIREFEESQAKAKQK
jgi:ribosomal protein L24E